MHHKPFACLSLLEPAGELTAVPQTPSWTKSVAPRKKRGRWKAKRRRKEKMREKER